MKLPVSVFIVTQDEEAHIAKTLSSVQSLDQVILVDSGSTDKTLDIARQWGAMVVQHSLRSYAKQKQLALSLCKHKWILDLDGDEAITPEIVSEFKTIMRSDTSERVRMLRDCILI